MSALAALRERIPDPARDIKLNLQAVLGPSVLTPAQKWGVAVASAVAARHAPLRAAVLEDARAEVPPAVLDDALAAAAVMAMNNVYYRFRHLVGSPVYGDLPPRLRMNRLARPAASKVDFELFALAVSAINGCGTCLEAHERVVLAGGLTHEHVHEAVRIAATVHAAAVALELGADLRAAPAEGAGPTEARAAE
jgi:alkyl hydroperoxide reductase subunit D